MLEIIKPGTNFDFVGKNKFFVSLSSIFVVLSLICLFSMGLNFGIDFSGGTEIHLRFDKPISVEQIRVIVEKSGYTKANILSIGEEQKEYVIRVAEFASIKDSEAQRIKELLISNYGKDKIKKFKFSGEAGDKFEIKFTEEVDISKLKEFLISNKVDCIDVKREGKTTEFQYLVILAGISKKIEEAITREVAGVKVEIIGVDAVGPQVGKDLRTSGLLAAIYSLIAITIYVAFRFDFRFAPGAFISLLHDGLITIGVLSLIRLEFDMTGLAAIMTLLGYSINDTIVVYDRIRENLVKYKTKTLAEIINISVNEMLARSIITSLTVLLVASVLLFYGGHTLRTFSFVMFFGVIIGTYSSIYIAAPISLYIERFINYYKLRSVNR
ncbi:MAG: protein translocase subunit SecF [Deltaproteobacteria bacterium]|nr:protein translocase subunit SecF [Deltaproteobacteria bacterium]